MGKYKFCPSCGTKNHPSSVECDECGVDLVGCMILDEDEVAAAQNEQTTEEPAPLSPGQLVRLCECGTANPPQLRKCQNCGEDISYIVPTQLEPAPSAQTGPCFALREIGGQYTFHVPSGSTIIGREHAMKECLASRSFVSRIHAKLVVEDGQFYVENLNTTNYTFVNNIRIPNGRIQLKAGDELALGGLLANGERQNGAAYFIVETEL